MHPASRISHPASRIPHPALTRDLDHTVPLISRYNSPMASRPGPRQLLVASHHTAAAQELSELAERRGYRVVRNYTGTQLLDQARTTPPDVVVLDQSLPDLDVLDASRALREDPQVGPGTPILLITAGRPSSAEHHGALRAGVWEYLQLPF